MLGYIIVPSGLASVEIFILTVTSLRFILHSIVLVDSVKVPEVAFGDGLMGSPIVLVVVVVMEDAESVNIPGLSSSTWFEIVVVLYSSNGGLETARARLEIRESLLSPTRGAARDDSVTHKSTTNQKPRDASIFKLVPFMLIF